jgi:hypothetical protein
MNAASVPRPVTRLVRRKVWIFARDVIDEAGPRTEYWTGEQGDNGGPSRSPFRADAFKFTTADAALQCAETHSALRDSEVWRIVPMIDMVPAATR